MSTTSTKALIQQENNSKAYAATSEGCLLDMLTTMTGNPSTLKTAASVARKATSMSHQKLLTELLDQDGEQLIAIGKGDSVPTLNSDKPSSDYNKAVASLGLMIDHMCRAFSSTDVVLHTIPGSEALRLFPYEDQPGQDKIVLFLSTKDANESCAVELNPTDYNLLRALGKPKGFAPCYCPNLPEGKIIGWNFVTKLKPQSPEGTFYNTFTDAEGFLVFKQKTDNRKGIFGSRRVYDFPLSEKCVRWLLMVCLRCMTFADITTTLATAAHLSNHHKMQDKALGTGRAFHDVDMAKGLPTLSSSKTPREVVRGSSPVEYGRYSDPAIYGAHADDFNEPYEQPIAPHLRRIENHTTDTEDYREWAMNNPDQQPGVKIQRLGARQIHINSNNTLPALASLEPKSKRHNRSESMTVEFNKPQPKKATFTPLSQRESSNSVPRVVVNEGRPWMNQLVD